MNIGIFIGKFQPEIGGGFTFEQSLISALQQIPSIHQLYFFYHGSPEQSNYKHVKYVNIPPSPRIKNRIIHKLNHLILEQLLERPLQRPLSPLENAIKDNEIDLVWFLAPHHEIIRFPYITTVWDLEHRLSPYFPEFSFQGWSWEQRDAHFKTVLPKASFIITGTTIGKQEIQHFYGIAEKNVRIMPHPTPAYALEAGAAVVSEKFKAKLPTSFFFYPAQFWAHKNHLGILHALNILKKKHKVTAHVVLTGSNQGNLEFVEEQTRALGLTRQVHFLGFVSTQELIYLYQHAEALVYASFCGPENIPPLEAMALKCPVIASRIEGSLEQLGDTALLFDPTNSEALAQAMLTLLTDRKIRTALIKKGLQRAQKYTPSDFVRDIYCLLDEFGPYRQTWGKVRKYV